MIAVPLEHEVGRLFGKGLRSRHVPGCDDGLDLLSPFGRVEARDQVQDRATRLVRDDLAGRERTAVAHPFDLVQHRLVLVAGTHEVRVQRLRTMGRRDREARGAQRLGDDLPAVQATPAERWSTAEKRVGLHLFEREQ